MYLIFGKKSCANDIVENIDPESFNQKFIDFSYQILTNNIKQDILCDEDYDYYELKYLEEINELFLRIKPDP